MPIAITAPKLVPNFEQKTKSVTLYHIAEMPDFQTATLNAADEELLFDLANSAEEGSLVAHCSAGVGRSATIIFAMACFKKRDEIFKGNADQIAENILKLLNELRGKRPQAIQTEDQLKQAIVLALKFRDIALRRQKQITPCPFFKTHTQTIDLKVSLIGPNIEAYKSKICVNKVNISFCSPEEANIIFHEVQSLSEFFKLSDLYKPKKVVFIELVNEKKTEDSAIIQIESSTYININESKFLQHFYAGIKTYAFPEKAAPIAWLPKV